VYFMTPHPTPSSALEARGNAALARCIERECAARILKGAARILKGAARLLINRCAVYVKFPQAGISITAAR
ncbi:hypothetical protein, partial [Streptomyces sp. NPDC060184]|uniref:hypothetical protein n=1 Tax=Streptomyces sp. NPDC060184 TaxID=3347064 RepID=UPI003656EE36